MTLGRRHALGLGLLLALVLQPPLLQPFLSAELRQPELGLKEAPHRSLSPLEWAAQAPDAATNQGSQIKPPQPRSQACARCRPCGHHPRRATMTAEQQRFAVPQLNLSRQQARRFG